MYCKFCGTPVADDSKFCPNCGKCLMEETPLETQESSNETYEETTETYTETTPFPEEEETTQQEPFTPYGEQEAPRYNNDPFTGPAHPSVKKNIIIAAVAIGIATIISIVLMAASISSLVKSGAFDDTMDALLSYEEETFPADPDEFVPPTDNDADAIVDPGSAGNTIGNVLNSGAAVDDGEGGVYYADLNSLYHRSAAGDITHLTDVQGESCSNLLLLNDKIYYVVNYEDEVLQEICCYDLNSDTSENIAAIDEPIYYMMAYDNEIYYTGDTDIYALNLADNSTRVVYLSENPVYDMFVTEAGVYYAHQIEGAYYELYRRDHPGNNETLITNGFAFTFADNALYADRSEEGGDAVYKMDCNGDMEKEVYRFDSTDSTSYITQMQVRNNVLYCITETYDINDKASFEVRAIDLESGKESLIDRDFTSTENPFYALNIGGDWLFYYDDNFDYGLHVYELD
ncbi:MAG: DUF5050 domain-containing protein [Firmicutes bacterium]|nr:DUF5050 domain-containing protein [Bacillota bacterium]